MTTPDNRTRSERSDAKRITINQIESKLRQVAAPVESGVEEAQSMLPVIIAAAAAALLIGAYVLGRRRGNRQTPVIEIRRL